MAKTDRGYGPLDNHMYMYDLGWLVKTILGFQKELDTAIDLKTIHYADPIQWDITTQYSPNTVVIDPKTGTAYMSKVPVPAGVQLDNTDYWVVIFNYQRIYDKIMSGVAFNDKENAEASKDISRYDFVWFSGDLYQAQRDIPQGSKYVPGVNIVATTIADALATYYGRDRVAQVINDTLTASETQTIGAKNRVISVTGDQTVTAGDIAETSANRTIKTTSDYHIDVDGDQDIDVAGTYTAKYQGTATDNATDKRIFNAPDIILNPTNPLTYNRPQALNAAFNFIPLKDNTNNLYKVLVHSKDANYTYCLNNTSEIGSITATPGDIIQTSGFYSNGDGGGATYIVIEAAENNGIDTFKTLNNNTAKLFNMHSLNQLGCKNTVDFDSSEIINYALKTYNLSECRGSYYCKKTLNVVNDVFMNPNLKIIFTEALENGVIINCPEGTYINGLNCDFNAVCNTGILIRESRGAKISSLKLINAKNTSIQIGESLTNNELHIYLDNLHIYNFSTYATGMEIYGTDCQLTNSEIYYTKNAVLLHSQLLYINDCHFWGGYEFDNSNGIICDNGTIIRLMLSNFYSDSFVNHINTGEKNCLLEGNNITFMGNYANKPYNAYCIKCGAYSVLNVKTSELICYGGTLFKLIYSNLNEYKNIPNNLDCELDIRSTERTITTDIGNNICLTKNTQIKHSGKTITQNTMYRIGFLLPSNITSCVPINLSINNQGINGLLNLIYYNDSSCNIKYTGERQPFSIIIGKPIYIPISGIQTKALPIALKLLNTTVGQYDCISVNAYNSTYGCLLIETITEDNGIVTLAEKNLNEIVQ